MEQSRGKTAEEIEFDNRLKKIKKGEKGNFLIVGSEVLNQPLVDVYLQDAIHLARQYAQRIKDVKLYERGPFGAQQISFSK